MSAHPMRFPNESGEYRDARDQLLAAEQDLNRRLWEVAALRRALPLGGAVSEDYGFEEGPADLAADEPARTIRLSELFAPGKDTLVLYSFMYGPAMELPCPMCNSILDSLGGASIHATRLINLAVVARSPLARIRAWARGRRWHDLRLLSSAGSSYNRDYGAEDEQGDQLPALNVFVRREGRIHHSYNAELLYAPAVPGEEPCHADLIWPLWHLLDLTPEGRGDFHPELSYPR